MDHEPVGESMMKGSLCIRQKGTHLNISGGEATCVGRDTQLSGTQGKTITLKGPDCGWHHLGVPKPPILGSWKPVSQQTPRQVSLYTKNCHLPWFSWPNAVFWSIKQDASWKPNIYNRTDIKYFTDNRYSVKTTVKLQIWLTLT